ncbi:MAG: shikimate kinase [Lachnospiraceae bacterium]|nr:shikimate kinase [Lachnospiraceae bacterium]
MNDKENLILIGMPASGKSTVGVILAKVLGMDFIDTDIVIQQREGKKLKEIIKERGTASFLECEEKAVLGIDVKNTVIATGGSVVYSDSAMEHLKHGGKVIYLKVGYEELMKRLKNIKERGVVLRPGESIEEMFETRSKLYEKYAGITIGEEGFSIEDTVGAIREKLNKN